MQRRNHYSEQPQPYRSSLCGISSHLNDKLEADTHEHDAQPPSAVMTHDSREPGGPLVPPANSISQKHVSGSVLVVFVSGVSGR
jgi:hypothetical protein